MLYAKINPAATKVDQPSPFSTSTTTVANYMTALARPYAVGASKTRFEVQYGNVTVTTDGYAKDFKQLLSGEVTLTSEQLASWGSDDTIVLNLIAAAVGTTVESTITSAPTPTTLSEAHGLTGA